MDITILGHVCIDKNTSERASYTEAGGPGMFMDRIFRHFPNAKTTIVSPYGVDFLPFQGCTTLLPTYPTSKKTLVYENIIKNDARKQRACNRTSATPPSITRDISTALAKTDILIIAPLLSNYSPSYLRSIIISTNPRALKLLLPQAYYRSFNAAGCVIKRKFKEAHHILPFIDIVIVSEKDHIHIDREMEVWTKTYPQLISVVTMAEKGAIVLYQGKKYILPATPLGQKEIVDSVGSGDVFSAGFAYRYRQTKNIRLAGTFANALARQCLLYTPCDITIDYPSLP